MRNLFELLYYMRELLTLLLAVLVSLTLLLTNETRQSVFLQATYAGLIASIPRTDFGIAEIISYKDENAILRERLIQYGLLNAELAVTARENAKLREVLQFAQRSPYRLQAAEVISRGAASLLSTVTISVGALDGAKVNDPILSLDGLMGKVLSVAQKASVVHLITDRNFRVSVKIGENAIRGVLRPLTGGVGEIKGVPPGTGVAIGDAVLTSGFSDIYPRNLPVAVVESVSHRPGETFSTIMVQIHSTPESAEHVFILLDDDDNN